MAMKLVGIITQAQSIAGISSFEGNAVDMNQIAASIAIFHQTLNSVNNDPKLNLVQSVFDYQRDVFPENAAPLPISISYPLPADCRRALKVISGSAELRKTDFSEIERHRRAPGMMNLYAVNDRRIELIFPGMAAVVYVKEFKEYMPQDEVDLPLECLDYIINLLAYNLALSFSSPRAALCKELAEKSYNALLGNLRVNEGEKYQSIYASLNRFSGRGGPWL